MAKISVVINTINEEKNIRRCLESVKWADEIVVVDMESSDKTVEIAHEFTNKIYSHAKTKYVEPARNFSIERATYDWVLILDADEEIPSGLVSKLQKIVSQDKFTHVFLPRKNIIFGKWMRHTGWWPDHLMRFFKKGAVTWSDEIHSVPQAIGEVEKLSGEEFAIVHHHYDSVWQFIERLNVYTSEECERLAKHHKFSWPKLIEEPFNEFFRRFFVHEGYKDGLHGLALSLLMSFYALVSWLKLWEKEGFEKVEGGDKFLSDFEKELKKNNSDLLYWRLTTQMQKQNFLQRFFSRIKRKLR